MTTCGRRRHTAVGSSGATWLSPHAAPYAKLGPIIAVLIALAACSSASTPDATKADPSTSIAQVALGQRIFETGTGADGRPITRAGGPPTMGMMSQGGCASCHGGDGHGHTTAEVQAPDITYSNLTDPAGMRELDGRRGHVYTDALIRRAVIQGIGADGDQLSAQMPHWQLSDAQWDALVAYLKALN
ncbi:MAG: cytochrome c [Actinomycetota bacterium]|nr:cytochrome c [Actinomycetota bacterium]